MTFGAGPQKTQNDRVAILPPIKWKYSWLHGWKPSPLGTENFKAALLKVVGVGSKTTLSRFLVVIVREATITFALVPWTMAKEDTALNTGFLTQGLP